MQFWHGQGCPLFDIVPPAFPLPTTASFSLQGALKGGFGEAVVACDMPELCKVSFLDSCGRGFRRPTIGKHLNTIYTGRTWLRYACGLPNAQTRLKATRISFTRV